MYLSAGRLVGLEELFRLCETQKRGGRGSTRFNSGGVSAKYEMFSFSFSPLGLQQALGYSD